MNSILLISLAKTLRIPRKSSFTDVLDIARDGGLDLLAELGVSADELGRKPVEHSQDIMKDEHLAIAIGPAPMPMVGIGSSAVIFAPSSRGIHSRTTANAPASATAWRQRGFLSRPLNFICSRVGGWIGGEAQRDPSRGSPRRPWP